MRAPWHGCHCASSLLVVLIREVSKPSLEGAYARAAVAALVGIAAGALTYWTRVAVTGFTDFDLMWFVGRAVLHGSDPYAAARLAYSYPRPMLYPLPAAILAAPFTILPEAAAPAAFTFVGFGLLAFGLTRRGYWPLIALASIPAVEAAQLGQWSPFFAAISLFPALSFFAVVKPTTAGAIAAAYLPRTINFGAIAVAITAIICATIAAPNWLTRWFDAVSSAAYYRPMILRPAGFVLLLVLVKWRRPEARMLALLACAPLSGMAYDALVLCVVPNSRREATVLAMSSLLAAPFRMVAQDEGARFAVATDHNALPYLVCLYLPALVLILRRPNRTVDLAEHSPVLETQRAD